MIRAELLKVVTTRTVLGHVLAGVAFAALNVVVIAVLTPASIDTLSEKREALAGLPILPALLGVVGVAGEFRHRTAAASALAAGGARTRLLVARTGAYALAGLTLSAAAATAAVALGLPLLAAKPGPALGAADVLTDVVANVGAGLLCVIIGVAIGVIVRHQVGAVVALLIMNFVLNPLVSMAGEAAGNLTPFGAAQVLAGMVHDTTLSRPAAALVLAVWAVPLLAVALAADRRRDLA